MLEHRPITMKRIKIKRIKYNLKTIQEQHLVRFNNGKSLFDDIFYYTAEGIKDGAITVVLLLNVLLKTKVRKINTGSLNKPLKKPKPNTIKKLKKVM